MEDNLKPRDPQSSKIAMDLHLVKKAMGIEVRRIILWGVLVLVAILKVKVAHATEAIPANAYLSFLEGSIFDEAADDGDSKVPPSYVTEKVTFYVDHFTTRERVVFQKWLDRAGPSVYPPPLELPRRRGVSLPQALCSPGARPVRVDPPFSAPTRRPSE